MSDHELSLSKSSCKVILSFSSLFCTKLSYHPQTFSFRFWFKMVIHSQTSRKAAVLIHCLVGLHSVPVVLMKMCLLFQLSFVVLCGSLQTPAVPSGPLWCLLWSVVVLCGSLWSFAVLCRPLLSPAVLCAVCYGPLWSSAVLCGPLRFSADPCCPQRSSAAFVMVLCGPLRYLVRPAG